jgi:hypothetical protein
VEGEELRVTLLDDVEELRDELLLLDEEEDVRVTVERPVELWRTPLSVRRALLLSDVVLTREGACVCVPVAREVEGEVAVCVFAAELPARILLTRPKEEALMDVGRAVVARPVERLFTPPCARLGVDPTWVRPEAVFRPGAAEAEALPRPALVRPMLPRPAKLRLSNDWR